VLTVLTVLTLLTLRYSPGFKASTVTFRSGKMSQKWSKNDEEEN
jgi:hypothetical protein